jgi:acylphosphatase
VSEHVSDVGEEMRAWLVAGRVQGVGFRWSTVQQARRLGLAGAVWNRSDGRVEVHARGEPSALDDLEAWLASGPPGARVRALEPIPAGEPASGDGFRVRH